MSALRALLASLWAAVWLRWQLLGKATTSGAAAGGADFQLAPADVPVEGVDYDPDELPAELLARLEDTRTELHSQARLRAERGDGRVAVRWRRVVGAATAALVSLAVVGAGANALVSGSTGVPAVDRLLGIYEANLSKPGTGPRGPNRADARMAPGTEVARATVRLPDGRRLVSVSYVSVDGSICSILIGSGSPGTGAGGCSQAGTVLERVRRQGAIWLGTAARAEGTVLSGFVGTDVNTLEASGPAGPLDMHIGRKWIPDLPDATALKPFLLVGPLARSRDPDPQSYRITAVMRTGERVAIDP